MAVIHERIFINPTRAGRVRTDRRTHIGRKAAGDRLQIFHNARTSPVNISSIFEHDEDVGVVKHGLRAHSFHLRRSQEGGDNGVGDLIFDDVGRFAFPVGVNDHLHV